MIKLSHGSKILEGSVLLPSSKSISNRLLVLRHVLQPDLKVRNLSVANDTKLLGNILDNLQSLDEVNAQDAGTAFRFLTAVLSVTEGERTLIGSKRMNDRPIKELVYALYSLGADITYLGAEGFPPLRIKGKQLEKQGELDFRETRSSQFISALLLIAHSIGAKWEIRINPEMNSKPFIRLTVNLLNQLGAQTFLEDDTIRVGEYHLTGQELLVESDWTSFYYFLGMALQAKHVDLEFPRLTMDGIQEEADFWKELKMKGLHIEPFNGGTRLFSKGDVTIGESHYDFSAFPDLWPMMAFSLAGRRMKFSSTGLSWLRYKESDRLEAVLNEYRKLSVSSGQDENQVAVDARKFYAPDGHVFKSYDDHRMAMSAAILGVENEIRIETPEVVNKSFPNFWAELEKIGFNIEEV